MPSGPSDPYDRPMPQPSIGSKPRLVTVPASTSNLGPGFDFLGLAVSLFLRVRVLGEAHDGASCIQQRNGTATTWPADAREDKLLRAFTRGCESFGVAQRALRFDVDSEIPLGRGLGSSGAAIAAGLLCAAAHAQRDVSIDELCALGTEMEGHPDNVCAALVGGCTLSVPLGDGRVRVVRQPLHASLGFAVAWPDMQVATSVARAALPKNVPFADAVENPRRLALLLEGLRTGDPELLKLGVEDRLHVRSRLPLVRNGADGIAAAYAAGAWLATISGSGSALFAIGPRGAMEPIARAMESALRPGGEATSRVVDLA